MTPIVAPSRRLDRSTARSATRSMTTGRRDALYCVSLTSLGLSASIQSAEAGRAIAVGYVRALGVLVGGRL